MAMVKNERDCSGAFDHFRLYSNLGTAFRRSCLSWYVGCVGHDFPIVFYLALGGSLLSYIYSAPPLKLKKKVIYCSSPDIGYLLVDTYEHCRTFKGTRTRAAFVFIIGFWLLDLGNNTVQVTSASKRSISNLNDLHNLWKHLIFSST